MKRTILIALACSIGTLIQAKGDGETRSTTVNVEISGSDVIRIEAKYTALTIETWNKNEVEIEASVRYDGKVTDKIQEFLDDFESRVKENINSTGGELSIDTDLDLPNKVQIGGKHVGINISYGDELKILYRIKSPGSNTYKIQTSYEDVNLLGNFDKVDFTQYSGDLKAGNIKSAKLNMKYGAAEIESLGNAEIEIYEQEIDANNADELTLNAKYSDLEMRKIGIMNAESYESDFKIGSIDELSGGYKYGEIKITNKANKAELTLYEVDIEAGSVGAILLENTKYSKFEIDEVAEIEFIQSYEDETDIGTLGSFVSKNSKYGNHTIDQLNSKFELNAYEDEVEIDRLGSSVSLISIEGKYIDSSIGVDDAPFVLTSDIKYGKVDYDESKVDVKRYIKDSDKLEIEAQSKNAGNKSLIKIVVKGYEVDVNLD